MTRIRQKWLTLTAVLGLAYWFFGNLYEAIVISPNWVVDSGAQLTRLNGFFVNTDPTLFFIPLTLLATVLVWVLHLVNRDSELRVHYRKASLFALALTALNILSVTTLITKLFGADYLSYEDELSTYAWRWNVLNVIRMLLTAATAFHLFGAFRKLDRQ
ncbi:hypothetical protein G4Z16_22095 [Streptomyces bathyalis]|uniref:DUF1772 domain-containing protein n=1 Tax=Streptomyces bathyalis TaxID=2710756 RepID=A0A7T1T934_9ACTN|nr:hypothetical protein [Streptomyces bathyalis]QPP08647.1 hypothetical protein G4Z16_22095 [Streptomyces bathyalis]